MVLMINEELLLYLHVVLEVGNSVKLDFLGWNFSFIVINLLLKLGDLFV